MSENTASLRRKMSSAGDLQSARCAMKALAARFELGGLTGMIASLLGKGPPDLRCWLVTGDFPALVRFEGAMFLNGPVWRLELTTVEWPK